MIRKISPVSCKLLVLYFYFCVSPWGVCGSRSKSYSKFFEPVDEVAVDKCCSVIVNYLLRKSIGGDPFSSGDSSLCASIFN